MKLRSIGPILTSAYLSAMLTSGVMPAHPTFILAAAVDATGTQKALERVVSTVSSNGWAVPKSEIVTAAQPKVIASTQQPKADPVMTDELMARLLKYANSDGGKGDLINSICVIFKLCKGNEVLELKQLESENPSGHYFMIPAAPGAKDVILIKKNENGSIDCFLTDKTYKLRAAATSLEGVATLIPKDVAEAKFKAELSLMAREASTLPPTGANVAAAGS